MDLPGASGDTAENFFCAAASLCCLSDNPTCQSVPAVENSQTKMGKKV
jgi:hypothetical protein